MPHSNHTGVDSLCHYSPLTRAVDKIAIYEEFLRLTQNGTRLLNFTLDRSSVLVDGESPGPLGLGQGLQPPQLRVPWDLKALGTGQQRSVSDEQGAA